MVCSGFTAEHANPTGAARRFSLRPLTPLARHFTVYLVNRKPDLPPGATMVDLAGHYAHALERTSAGAGRHHRAQAGRAGSRAGELAAAKDRSVADARAWVEAMLGFEVYAHHTYSALGSGPHGEHHNG